MDRRKLLKLLAALAATPALAQPHPTPHSINPLLSKEDDAFLDDLERRACLYFTEQSSLLNGQVLDRAAAITDGKLDSRRMSSIAATGFGLAALCIADKRSYQTHSKVLDQVKRTLRFHANTLPNIHGFFYHFNDINTGTRFRNTELSTIDTALLMCGVLTARAYFSADDEIQQLATTLYNRVDWTWFLNIPGELTLSMGWKPESGFEKSRWNHYCELMMIYLLAIGSPTHPIDPASWDAWSRPKMSFAGFDYISAADPLFVHQYSHAFFDFRHQTDKYTDYFANSILATRAHERFCLNLGHPYSLDYWGISASDSQHGYTAWGGPGARKPNPTPAEIAAGFGGIDGSVVPCATAGSLPFVPVNCLRVLRSLKDKYGKYAWGRYGFCDAFHPDAQWYDPDVLGIDLGISVLMAENLRSGFLWETFMRNPEPVLAMQRAGFHATPPPGISG
jgi:hypothetical protein